jgi:hypothetical protein
MLSKSLVLLTTLAATSALAVDLGPGIVATTQLDSGERLNVDQSFTLSLAAGTYAVTDFTYASTGTGGAVPFISTSSAANSYDLLWIGSALSGVADTTVSTNPAGFFTLSTPATVYGGFYNTVGGRVAFTGLAGKSVDHNGAAVVPRGGVATNTFSNPDLGRTYAFKIGVETSPLLTIGPGFLSNAGADGGERLNIDAAHPLTLSPGSYNVDDFSFQSTAAAGTVTPFLARSTGTDSYQTVWVGGAVGGILGDLAVDPTGGFTLTGSESLFAGFYTASGGRVAYTEGVARPPGFGLSEHDDTFTGPSAAGQSVTGFSFPDLARTYSFSVGVTAVPEPASAALLSLSGLLAARRRRHSNASRSS